RLARIGERMVDQLLLLAALRGRDLDLMPALDRERFAEQRAVLDLVRQEDATRRRLIVIELRQKRAEHFARFERAVRAREVGAVAPVLTGAEEEHLDARISALLVHGEHVGVLHAARVDALARLDRRERREPVAVNRGTLEIERTRRLFHFGGEFLLHGAALAREK